MRLLSFLFLNLLSFAINAQQNHFIYLQTENRQPFFVKLENKVFSSSASGYVILAKLIDGNYKLTVGFPKNSAPEQVFNCIIDNKDQGFIIKNFGDKGWGFLNLQSSEVTMAGEVMKKAVARENSNDPFSNMLANVVHDSTINQKEVVKEEPKKEEPLINKEETKQTVILKNVEQPVVPGQNDPPASNKEIAYTSSIKRTSKKKNKEGLQLVYVDEYNNQADTINVFLPVEKIEKVEKKKAIPDSANLVVPTQSVSILKPEDKILEKVPKASSTPQEVKTDQANNDSKSSQPLQQTPKETAPKNQPKFIELKDPPMEKTGTVPVSRSTMVNSDCKASASDDDFLKVRKKMVAEHNDDDMIRTAKKTFRSKCFTTEQVKNLSVLFLKDEGKYSFFETAYPFVLDTDQFQSLESQLSDSYYITRFKAMIHH